MSPARALGVCSGKLYGWAGAGLLAAALSTCKDGPAPSAGQRPGTEVTPSVGERPAVAAAAPAVTASSVPAAPSRPTQQTPTTRKYMLTHYADSVRMRQALVAGKLAEVQSAAAAIARDAWTPRLRGDYQPLVQRVRDAARAVQGAPSLMEAANALGTLGGVCASCHLKFGGPGSPLVPVQLTEPVDATMVAHALATDRLWEGLIVPSDSSWLEGARVLRDAPALDSDVAEVAAAAQHLRRLARESQRAEVSQRGRLYSSVLLTCAACHERLGIQVAASAPR